MFIVNDDDKKLSNEDIMAYYKYAISIGESPKDIGIEEDNNDK